MSNRVSAETDITLALRKYLAENVNFPKTGGYQDGVIEVSGNVGGIPYGDIYQKGDLFTQPVGDGQLGKLYYVAASAPGSDTLVVQEEISPSTARPRVTFVTDAFTPELDDTYRVAIGIRSRPSARTGFVRQLSAGRRLSFDQQYVILTEPFWTGGFWLHVEGRDKLETSYVFEVVNARAELLSDIYKFRVRMFPERVDVVNLEVAGIFKNVLAINVLAGLTEATPIDQLPDGMPVVAFPWDKITGVSPVVEQDSTGIPLPWYGEKVGDYPLSTEADTAGISDMPPTE